MVANNKTNNNNNNQESLPVKHEGTFKEIDQGAAINNDSNQNQNQQEQQQQIPDLNDTVQDLKRLSKMCNQKVIDYADITAIFKQIGEITDNLSLAVSVYLQHKGELDPARFKLVK